MDILDLSAAFSSLPAARGIPVAVHDPGRRLGGVASDLCVENGPDNPSANHYPRS